MTSFKKLFAVLFFSFSILPSTSFAIAVGTYKLANHPDGGAASPYYGLRLDGLIGGNSSDTFTFDFDDASSDMKLDYDGSSIRIYGTAFGGRDIGSSYAIGSTAIWTIDFTYSVGVSQPGGEGGLDDVTVTGTGGTCCNNFGSISSSFGTWGLTDQSNRKGLFFQMGDEGGVGHRGYDGISGWGWMNHYWTGSLNPDDNNTDPARHLYSSDWLFTMEKVAVIPEPSVWLLFALGLAGLTFVRKKRAA